jgi:hypothetical protein
MSYFGALPIPTAAQRKEGEALEQFAVDKFGNGRRIILMPRSDGGAPFWAVADDVTDAYKKNPAAKTYSIPRILTADERSAGKTVQAFGVKAEDVVAVVEKFAPAKGPVFTSRGSGLPIGPSTAAAPAVVPTPASTEAPSASKLPIVLGVAGVAIVAALMLRRR